MPGVQRSPGRPPAFARKHRESAARRTGASVDLSGASTRGRISGARNTECVHGTDTSAVKRHRRTRPNTQKRAPPISDGSREPSLLKPADGMRHDQGHAHKQKQAVLRAPTRMCHAKQNIATKTGEPDFQAEGARQQTLLDGPKLGPRRNDPMLRGTETFPGGERSEESNAGNWGEPSATDHDGLAWVITPSVRFDLSHNEPARRLWQRRLAISMRPLAYARWLTHPAPSPTTTRHGP